MDPQDYLDWGYNPNENKLDLIPLIISSHRSIYKNNTLDYNIHRLKGKNYLEFLVVLFSCFVFAHALLDLFKLLWRFWKKGCYFVNSLMTTTLFLFWDDLFLTFFHVYHNLFAFDFIFFLWCNSFLYVNMAVFTYFKWVWWKVWKRGNWVIFIESYGDFLIIYALVVNIKLRIIWIIYRLKLTRSCSPCNIQTSNTSYP